MTELEERLVHDLDRRTEELERGAARDAARFRLLEDELVAVRRELERLERGSRVLEDEVAAVERTLGVNPHGDAADVAARLKRLERELGKGTQ